MALTDITMGANVPMYQPDIVLVRYASVSCTE